MTTVTSKLEVAVAHQEALSQELSESLSQNKELAAKLQAVEADLENEKHARELIAHEYRANKEVVDAACKDKERLERDNLELIDRLKGMKMESEMKLEMALNMEIELNAKRKEIVAHQEALMQKEKKWGLPNIIPRSLKARSMSLLEVNSLSFV